MTIGSLRTEAQSGHLTLQERQGFFHPRKFRNQLFLFPVEPGLLFIDSVLQILYGIVNVFLVDVD